MQCKLTPHWVGGGGDRGVWNSRLPYLLLPLAAPFRRSSHLLALYRRQNVTQYCEIFLLFSRVPATLGIPLPALSPPPSRTLPAPILPGSRPPVPPPPTIGLLFWRSNDSFQLCRKRLFALQGDMTLEKGLRSQHGKGIQLHDSLGSPRRSKRTSYNSC